MTEPDYPQRFEVPSIEDPTFSIIPAWRSQYATTDTLALPPSSCHALLMVAPYPITILSAVLAFSRGQDASGNYWTAALRNCNPGSLTGAQIASFDTSDGIPMMTGRNFTQMVATAQRLNTGQALVLAMTRSNANAPNLGSALVTLRTART